MKGLERTHSLYCGIIHEPNITTRAIWMNRSVKEVLLEPSFASICYITDSARMAKRSNRNRTMGGFHVLWPMVTYVDDEGSNRYLRGTHSLNCGIIDEPKITTRALWMHGGVTVVLLERTWRSVWPIADSASNGGRRRRPRLWRPRRSRGKRYLVNLLFMLRSRPSV
jgi:hypothetical protein